MNPTIEQTRAAASVDRTIQLLATGEKPGGACAPDLAKGPWEFDAGPASYGPGSSMGDVIPTGSPRQGALPEAYRTASNSQGPFARSGVHASPGCAPAVRSWMVRSTDAAARVCSIVGFMMLASLS